MTEPNPHETEENPEDFIGDEVADPWEDASAENWPNEEVPV